MGIVGGGGEKVGCKGSFGFEGVLVRCLDLR